MTDSSGTPPPSPPPETAFDEAWATALAQELGATIVPPSTPVGTQPDAGGGDNVPAQAAELLTMLVAKRNALLERIAAQPDLDHVDATSEETVAYAASRSEARNLLDPDLPNDADLLKAEQLIDASDDTYRVAMSRIAALIERRERHEALREQLSHIAGLEEEDALAEDITAVLLAKKQAAEALATDPPTAESLQVAAGAIAQAESARKAAMLRIEEVRAKRREDRLLLLEEIAGLPDLDPEEALAEELSAVGSGKEAATTALGDETPSLTNLEQARAAIAEAKKAAEGAQVRILKAQEERCARRVEILEALAQIPSLDADEATEREATEFAKLKERVQTALALELPKADALETATDALAAATQLQIDAAKRIETDQNERATQKAALLDRAEKAELSPKATSAETDRRGVYNTDLAAHLDGAHPKRDALLLASELVDKLEQFVKDTNEDIKTKREVRFKLAADAGQKLSAVVTQLPDACPEAAKTELAQKHSTLQDDLAPFLEWEKVTTWDTPDLESVTMRIGPLADEFESLRTQVNSAVEKLRVAREAAATAIDSPKGTTFSSIQKPYLQGRLDSALEEARKDIFAADPHITALTKLAKDATALARVRKDMQRRIAALPADPPTDAAETEADRWRKLRATALKAADEVTEP